jgi:hypothetical protein
MFLDSFDRVTQEFRYVIWRSTACNKIHGKCVPEPVWMRVQHASAPPHLKRPFIQSGTSQGFSGGRVQ